MPKIRYICQKCGACCRWPGVVRVKQEEIDGIARHLKISPEDFINKYTVLAPDRCGLVLTEKLDGACIFLENNLCRINPVKPQQCCDFPEKWNCPDWETICRAQRIINDTSP